MTTVTLEQAKAHLDELLASLQPGEELLITDRGHPLAQVKKAGLDAVYFAYGGGDGTPGKPYSYRVQGPTFVIEFLNEQKDSAGNPANHIHSAWRNLRGDFGTAGG